MRMAAARSKADTDHDYRMCGDEDCPRFPCRVYKEGYARGYLDGSISGYAQGFGEGYAQGAEDTVE